MRWFITKKHLVALIGILVATILILLMSGCGSHQRAQAGADAQAGLKALRMKLLAMEAGYATAEALAILAGVEKYIPAATGVNPSEWPAPRMSPNEILEDPSEYDDNAPPIPAPSFNWLGLVEQIATLGAGLLLGGGAAVPLISRAKTALRIACQLADANANAETDTDVERNKRIAAQQQAAAGVLKLTQAVRGKS